MNNYTKELQGELNDSGKIPVFEIEVIDSDLARDWISCDVYFQGNSIVAERDAVSSAEERSDFIAKTSISVDSFFGLQEHLEWLLEKVEGEIMDGDLYDLALETGLRGRCVSHGN